MATIVIDANLREKLIALSGVTEFRDESGVVIGQFVPVTVCNGSPVDFDDVPDAELDRIEQHDARFSAQQVLDRLRELRG